MAPSPTAEATRFIESSRTSPAANTPGMLVSSAYGARPSGQRRRLAGRWQVLAGHDEALGVALDTRRRASRYAASAPMKTNSQLVSTSSCAPVSRSRKVSASRCSSPRAADHLACAAAPRRCRRP